MLFCSCVFQSCEYCHNLARGSNLTAFRTFVRFALVWFCLFPLPLGVWEGLRLVIVDFSFTFFYVTDHFSVFMSFLGDECDNERLCAIKHCTATS